MTAGRIPESLRIFRVRWDRAVAAVPTFFLSVIAAQAGLAALKSAGGEMRREQR